MIAMIKAKAATSPSRPHSTVRFLWPMPLQVDTPGSKPSGSYGEGEAVREGQRIPRMLGYGASWMVSSKP
jgi:hypothetical protein